MNSDALNRKLLDAARESMRGSLARTEREYAEGREADAVVDLLRCVKAFQDRLWVLQLDLRKEKVSDE